VSCSQKALGGECLFFARNLYKKGSKVPSFSSLKDAFDAYKSNIATQGRNFLQISNLPMCLIKSDPVQDNAKLKASIPIKPSKALKPVMPHSFLSVIPLKDYPVFCLRYL
ncbi:hypothetical protein, partial [Moellerella wisconsensis]|uniref:hypothetical protein n=1 Tax=Moellerella wisconsensis TaxID=158849 RepID=UPI00307618A9